MFKKPQNSEIAKSFLLLEDRFEKGLMATLSSYHASGECEPAASPKKDVEELEW
jgi:hypothetical protein